LWNINSNSKRKPQKFANSLTTNQINHHWNILQLSFHISTKNISIFNQKNVHKNRKTFFPQINFHCIINIFLFMKWNLFPQRLQVCGIYELVWINFTRNSTRDCHKEKRSMKKCINFIFKCWPVIDHSRLFRPTWINPLTNIILGGCSMNIKTTCNCIFYWIQL